MMPFEQRGVGAGLHVLGKVLLPLLGLQPRLPQFVA